MTNPRWGVPSLQFSSWTPHTAHSSDITTKHRLWILLFWGCCLLRRRQDIYKFAGGGNVGYYVLLADQKVAGANILSYLPTRQFSPAVLHYLNWDLPSYISVTMVVPSYILGALGWQGLAGHLCLLLLYWSSGLLTSSPRTTFSHPILLHRS